MKKMGLVFFALIIIYFIFLIQQDIINYLALKQEGDLVSKVMGEQTLLTAKLKKKLADLNSKLYVEGLARTRLGLVKSGETAFKVLKVRR